MASEELSHRLRDDELAFYFSGGTGVVAGELGDFLIRVATVARRKGAELQVTALEPGSLAVIMRAMKRSGAAVGHEFRQSPIQASGASVALVAVIVNALAGAMSPEHGEPKPLAKAGAELVGGGHVDRIEIITHTKTTVVMDAGRAREIRENAARKKGARLVPASEVLQLVEAGRSGGLAGDVVDVRGELHFRPDGFRYLVPIDMDQSAAASELFPGMHVTVAADLRTRRGQPDMLVVYQVMPDS